MRPREESGSAWGTGLPPIEELPKFGRELEHGFEEVLAFIATAPFQSVLTELRALPVRSRHHFVGKIVLNERQLKKRGVCLPSGIIIQKSRFGDRRPNLFCVKKYVRPGLNVNITFAPNVRVIQPGE